jgi:SAM-dependent methyltransferase
VPEQWLPNWSLPEGSRERWVEDYERGRPGWPRDLLEVIDQKTGTALDLGAGTGKLAEVLASAFDEVIAVEPAETMRQMLRERRPSIRSLAGTAEAIPIGDASVDVVFAAQAFHTFDNVRALPEIARVLRPTGALVLLWNLPASEWQPSTTAAEAVLKQRMPEVEYVPLDLGGPDASSGWQPVGAEGLFEPFRARIFPNPQTLDRDGLVAFYATMGWLADLPDDERLPLLEQVRSRLDQRTYRRSWETHVHWAHVCA